MLWDIRHVSINSEKRKIVLHRVDFTQIYYHIKLRFQKVY